MGSETIACHTCRPAQRRTTMSRSRLFAVARAKSDDRESIGSRRGRLRERGRRGAAMGMDAAWPMSYVGTELTASPPGDFAGSGHEKGRPVPGPPSPMKRRLQLRATDPASRRGTFDCAGARRHSARTVARGPAWRWLLVALTLASKVTQC